MHLPRFPAAALALAVTIVGAARGAQELPQEAALPLALVEGAVRALSNIGGEQPGRVADDLARRLVSTLPEPLAVPDQVAAR